MLDMAAAPFIRYRHILGSETFALFKRLCMNDPETLAAQNGFSHWATAEYGGGGAAEEAVPLRPPIRQ